MSLSAPQRPGPLRDLPLDRFLPLPSRPNKRPHSPDRPSLFSPTKRRILNEEGVFHPEKTVKSSIRGRPIATPVSLSGLVASSAGPAKKLDFGSPKKLPQKVDGGTEVDPRSLAPSPELVPSIKSTPRRTTVLDDDYFATPERVSRPSSPTFIPRELPLFSDPRSIHYPGFKVHQDPHIVVMDCVNPGSLVEKEKEGSKENVPPRKKAKKSMAESTVDAQTLLMTPEGKKRELERLLKTKATPATPKKTLARERHDLTSPTPRRPSGLLRSAGGRTPVVSEEERKQRRRMLQDEVEEACGDDDDDEAFRL